MRCIVKLIPEKSQTKVIMHLSNLSAILAQRTSVWLLKMLTDYTKGPYTSLFFLFCWLVVYVEVSPISNRAGNNKVYELHGTVWKHKCIKNGHPHEQLSVHSSMLQQLTQETNHQSTEKENSSVIFTKESEDMTLEKNEDSSQNHTQQNTKCTEGSCEYDLLHLEDLQRRPRCQVSGCRSYLRPECVLFTEGLPSCAWNRSVSAVSKLESTDIMIVCGNLTWVYLEVTYRSEM